MLFFWALFDASFSYMVPVVITASGYSKTFMGVILGTSSIFGAAFDFFLTKFLHNIHFRRIYLVMFSLCFFSPALLFKGNPVWVFVGAMALWGFYYDLFNFGNVDFVSRKALPDEHSRSFGVIWMFRALGYTIAPLIIGSIAGETLGIAPYFFMWSVISFAIALFFILLYLDKTHPQTEYVSEIPVPNLCMSRELVLWKKVGKILFPILIMTWYVWIYDAFFWTIGPLMSDVLKGVSGLNGLFLTIYTVPPLIFGFLVSSVNRKLGKKRTAHLCCFTAGVLLASFFLIHNPYYILFATLCASICMAFSIPSLNAAYADYVTESPKVEKEIEALQDFFTNIGYIIGPILAGFLADKVGNILSFSYLGVAGMIITTIAFFVTPEKIHVIVER